MLWERWQKEIAPKLKEDLKTKNPMALPRVIKVIVHMGIAAEKEDSEVVSHFSEQLSLITGQKPVICRAKKSISGFKLRKGEIVGLKVTLRGKRMYDFLEKLFSLVLPRLRDFRGMPAEKFDSLANYSLGIPDQTVFPEISAGKVKKIKGIEVTIVTNSKDRDQAKILLERLGLQFTKER